MGFLLLGALTEEFLFRGLLLRLCHSLSNKRKIILISLTFSLMHLSNYLLHPDIGKVLVQTAFAFAAGILLTAVAVRSKTIPPSVLAHFGYNAACVLSGATFLPLLYIDPGTGSMLFTVLLGMIGAGIYSIRLFVLKMRMRVTGNVKKDKDRLPFVVFSDNKRYWTVFEPVVRELTSRGRQVTYLTASEDDPAFSCGIEDLKTEYLGDGNKMFGRLNNLNADIVLSTTPGLDVYQWRRSPEVSRYVHIPHAASEIILYRMFGIDYYDDILLSGQYQIDNIRALEKLRGLPPKELVLVGIPYMDRMTDRLNEAKKEEHERTILLGPSWGKSAILSVYGGRIIEVLLKTGWHVIVRPHPQSFTAEKDLLDRLMREYPNSEQLVWNRDTDNFDVLCRSDILISDFSGIIFEFSLVHDKPVIYTDPNFDLAPYDAWWLKEETLWTATALPKLGRQLTEENMEQLPQLIEECLSDPRYAEGRRKVMEETWAYPGEGARRTADFLEKEYEELTRKEEQK